MKAFIDERRARWCAMIVGIICWLVFALIAQSGSNMEMLVALSAGIPASLLFWLLEKRREQRIFHPHLERGWKDELEWQWTATASALSAISVGLSFSGQE
jgi:hypothetical protein